MQAKITQRFVDSLEPKAKPYAVRDLGLKGFLLRVRPNGGMSWLFDYRNAEGRRLTYKIGSYPGLKAEGAAESQRASPARLPIASMYKPRRRRPGSRRRGPRSQPSVHSLTTDMGHGRSNTYDAVMLPSDD